MDAYHRFKDDFIKHALGSLNAFEVNLAKEETQRTKETQELHKQVERLENEILKLKSQNQEWASKYAALNALLQPQLLPDSENDVKGKDSSDQPTLRDFAHLTQANGILRRKLKATQDELHFKERHGQSTRKTRYIGLKGCNNEQVRAVDQHMQSNADHHATEHEVPSTDHEDEDRRPKANTKNYQSHANQRPQVDVGLKQSLSRLDKDLRNLLPSLEPSCTVDEAISADIARGPPTPVSESSKEPQKEKPKDPRQDVPLIEPSMSDDETSSETQFSITRQEIDESATQDSVAEDSDSPVIVSERSLKLKRKRRTRNEVDLPAPGASRLDEAGSRGSAKVKIELGSSSQCGDTMLPSTNRANETMDLDEVGSRMKTPKKSRQSLPGTASPENRQSSSSHEPVDEMLDDNCDREVLYGRSQSEPVFKTIAHSARISDEHPIMNAREAYVLQPKDGNVLLRTAQQKGHQFTATPHSIRRLRRDQRSAAAAIMAEDGDTSNTPQKSQSGGNEQAKSPKLQNQSDHLSARPSSSHQRLDKALNEPPTRKPFLTPKGQGVFARDLAKAKRSTPKSNQKRQSKLLESTPSMTNGASISNNAVQHALTTEHDHLLQSAARRTFRMPQSETVASSKQDKKLRSCPPENLMLGDFVMNPNARMSIAYNEPVRTRDLRKCLPTCTNPECCGTKFLKVAQIGGVAPFKSGLWSSSPPNEDDVDENLLLGHLDHDHAQLRSMSKTDKKNLLLQLQAQQMGNAIGKHKLTGYERAKTPPGFWRADMPSTQEVEADREEARRLERQKVRERWHEAMAEDGKGLWKFRDE